jgi:hypothetical protein
MQTVPLRLRRGLLRLYVAVTVPWVAWFGYHILDALNRHRSQHYVADTVWALLMVPIGGPVLFLVIVWVVAGFRKPAIREADYHRVIGHAVSKLAHNTVEARRTLYDRARAALTAQLHGRDLSISESQIAFEKLALEAAIRRVEEDRLRHLREPSRIHRLEQHPSTALLIVSIFLVTALWVQDFTSMSLYWVARLPKANTRRSVCKGSRE